jgi:WD40 repeat protein
MAPEQWMNTEVDARTDVYALGVLAYECLAGTTPFPSGDRIATRAAHLQAEVPSLGPGFPPKLDAVVRRALAKKPKDRIESALDLARQLRAASDLTTDLHLLPEVGIDVREVMIAEGPQPLAEALAEVESARLANKLVDAARLTVRVAVRYLATIALATRARMGMAGEGQPPQAVIEFFRKLHADRLDDREWWLLCQELCRPFATCRDAYPVPELVELFFLPGGEQPRAHPEVQFLFSAVESDGELDPGELTKVATNLGGFLKKLFFLARYPLKRCQAGYAEEWTGLRRAKRHGFAIQSNRPLEGQFFISSADGVPLLSLWPLMQAISPSPGAADEAFFFDGNGRHGARLIAFPVGFERYAESFWSWFRENIFDEIGRGRKEEMEQAPYVGLASFTTAQAGIFFGREREAESFSNRLRVQSLVAAVGPSGAGKSSFMQAGVVPLLPADWKVLTVRPGPSPLAALLARLSAEGLDVSLLRQSLYQDDRALQLFLRTAAARQRKTFVLVVDQFEEVITLCADSEERRLYAEALTQAAGAPEQPIRVVLTLRDDFLIRIQQIPAMRERLAPGLHLLGTPQRDDLLRILETPARKSGYAFDDPELTREMVDAVADQPGALALLSFTASKLWDFRDRGLHRLTRKAYQALGGVGGALAHHAEATLAKMDGDEKRLVREAFRHLVTAEGTRAVLTRKEMAEVLGGKVAAERVLEQLIGARLLVASEGTGGEDRVEVIHEALLASWPRLVNWQREDAESVRMRDALRAAARQWNERGRGSGLLWRGDALLEYQLWRSRYPGLLTDTEESFAAASVREQRRGRQIRTGLVLAAFAGLAAGLVVLYRANGRAELNARVAAERLIEAHEEQGRELALAEKPQQALVYLGKAAAEGAHGVVIDYLLGKALWALEGQQRMLSGHTATVLMASFSPDGASAITASTDGTARIWDSRSGRLRSTLTHLHAVRTARFSPDGQRALTASDDKTAKIWNAESGQLLLTLPHSAEVRWAEYSKDGHLVVTAGNDHTARLWNADTGEPIAALDHADRVTLAILSPVGERVATTSIDGTVKLWSVSTRQRIAAIVGAGETLAMEFSPDGSLLATADSDGGARVFDAHTGEQLSRLPADSGMVQAISFSPDGAQLATGGDDNSAKIWDSRSAKLLYRLEGHTGSISSVRYSPDGQRLATSSADGTVRIWTARTGDARAALVGHMDSVWRAEFSSDGDQIISAGLDWTAIIWDAHRTSFAKALGPSDHEVTDAVFTSKGNLLVTADRDQSVSVWDVARGELVHKVDLGGTTPSFVSVSPDGTLAVAPDREHDLVDTVLRLSDGHPTLRLTGHDKPIDDVAFGPDGRQIATAAKDAVMLRDAKTGEALTTIATDNSTRARVAFSPDGKRALVTLRREAVVVDAASGAKLLTLSGHRRAVNSATFSSDGRYIATAAGDSVRLWDAQTGRPVRIFEPERQEVSHAEVNRDSTLMLGVAWGGIGLVYVWDVATGKLLDLIREPGGVHTASFSPDGQWIVTASWRHGAKLWPIRVNQRPPGELAPWIQCHIPFRLDHEQLVRARPDASSCRN